MTITLLTATHTARWRVGHDDTGDVDVSHAEDVVSLVDLLPDAAQHSGKQMAAVQRQLGKVELQPPAVTCLIPLLAPRPGYDA